MSIHSSEKSYLLSYLVGKGKKMWSLLQSAACHYAEAICSLLIGLAFYLLSNEWFETWNAYRLHLALATLPFITHIVWIYAQRRNLKTTQPHIEAHKRAKPINYAWLTALIFVCVIIYVSISFWNYCAWWMGDNWVSHGYPWHWITRWYMTMNSRSGDIILRLTQQDYSRCIVWLTLPFFFILVAYSTIRLNGEKLPKASSYTGILLVCFVVSLCLLSVNTEYARDYIDFAPMTSYLWPTAATFLLLTHFHPHNGTCFVSHQNGISTRIKLALIFLLGIYCGWGNEVGCIMFTLFAVCWFSYQIWKKRAIALECWAATMGFIWGTCMIFLSPAHAGRQAASIANRLVNPQNMTSGELNAWLDNLTWDKINMLRHLGVIVLDGIPLMQHLKFLPFLAERFWNCCSTPSIALLILLAIALSRPGTKYRRRTILFVAIGGYSMAWLGACAYLAACIPGYPSFLPASYVIVLTCGWVFMQIPYKWIPQTVICAVILISACNIYGSAATIAYPYKALERKMWDEIQKQKNAGIKDIRLERRYRLNIRDGMGLLNGARFNDNPRKYPNTVAANYFKVRSIGYKDNTATQKPNDTPARK